MRRAAADMEPPDAPTSESDPPCKQRLVRSRSRTFSLVVESAPPAYCHQPARKAAGSVSSLDGGLSEPQRERQHRDLLAGAFQFARTGKAEAALLSLLAAAPDLLDRAVDANGDSPIGVALLRGQAGPAELLVDLATRRQPDLLLHRSGAGETLLMLAMGERQAPRSVVRQLVGFDPAQVYEKYDVYGKNAFHHCAEDASVAAAEGLLESLEEAAAKAAARVDLSRVRLALEMPDCAGWTPLHYLASADRVEMLQLLHQFCQRHAAASSSSSSSSCCSARLNLAVPEMGARRWTPLRLATESGSARVREFLLDVGLVDDDDDSDGGSGSDSSDSELEEVAARLDSKATAEADLLQCMRRMSLLSPEELQSQSQELSKRLLQSDQMQHLYRSVQRLSSIRADHIQLAKLATNPVHCLIGFLPRDKRSRCGQENG